MEVDSLILARAPQLRSKLFWETKQPASGYIFTKHCAAQANVGSGFGAASIVRNVAKLSASAADRFSHKLR
ncbi:MAG: hypothetical protein ACKEQI_00395 [Candidatus Hodgkinia cicadicola]